MHVIDLGTGTPVVMIPGIQGRWEWMQPAVHALARRCRVITFSLADEPTANAAFDERTGFDCYVEQVRQALDARAITSAAICGVSYGGLIAAAFAARYPERSASLVLVSAVPPSWRPDARVRFYLRAPRLLSPLFCLASVRLYSEIAAATPGRAAGIRAALAHWWTAATHLFSPSRMARRVRMLDDLDLSTELMSMTAPVLVVTGESALERVVPVHRTEEYVTLWPRARRATIARTGHLGLITRPDAFAAAIVPFANEMAAQREQRRRIG
jgi:3-oxoadipate enol-lactonase